MDGVEWDGWSPEWDGWSPEWDGRVGKTSETSETSEMDLVKIWYMTNTGDEGNGPKQHVSYCLGHKYFFFLSFLLLTNFL